MLHLQSVYFIILGPPPESLSLVPKQDSKQAPECGKSHIGHDRRDVSTLQDPGGDKFAETISPKILVHSDGDENATSGRLVRVDCVGRRDGWQGCYLDAGAGVADYDDSLRREGQLCLFKWFKGLLTLQSQEYS